jgi:cytochrome b561
MQLRNGGHGYGLVTKSLHWLTVVAITAQFVVGLTMSRDDGPDRAGERLAQLEDRRKSAREAAKERFERGLERRAEAAEARGEAAAERFDERADRLEDRFRARQDRAERRFEELLRAREDELDGREDRHASPLHVGLGLLVLALGLVRLLWRRTTPLPPWAEHLSDRERRWASWLEKALLALLLLVPATGLLLLTTGSDWLAVHVTAQVLLLAVIAAHVGLVLRHTVVRRHRHLARML